MKCGGRRIPVVPRYPSAAVGFISNAPAPTEIYTLSLHDALPISSSSRRSNRSGATPSGMTRQRSRNFLRRSEEHTSELQSRFDLVCRLLLEKKKYRTPSITIYGSVHAQ